MQSKELATVGQRTFVIVFDEGEDVLSGLEGFAVAQDLSAAEFTGLGAFSRAVLGFFDMDRRDYERIAVDEQVEVLTLVGNVALHDGRPKLHPHVVLGRRDGGAIGGHLLEARVRPTLEIMLTESPRHLRRSIDDSTGLPLIDLERGN
jgi:predicted DNA-binding protein with PD1-like motif